MCRQQYLPSKSVPYVNLPVVDEAWSPQVSHIYDHVKLVQLSYRKHPDVLNADLKVRGIVIFLIVQLGLQVAFLEVAPISGGDG